MQRLATEPRLFDRRNALAVGRCRACAKAPSPRSSIHATKLRAMAEADEEPDDGQLRRMLEPSRRPHKPTGLTPLKAKKPKARPGKRSPEG